MAVERSSEVSRDDMRREFITVTTDPLTAQDHALAGRRTKGASVVISTHQSPERPVSLNPGEIFIHTELKGLAAFRTYNRIVTTYRKYRNA